MMRTRTSRAEALRARFILALLAVAVVAMAGCATSTKNKKSESPAPPESVTRAADALKEASEAVRANPKDARNQYCLGNALFDAGRYDEARAAYEAAIKLAPNHESAHCNLGLCLKRLGLAQEAVAEYRKALSLDPNDATASFNLVSVLEGLGDFGGAIKELEPLAARQSQDVQVLAHLGNALYQVGRYPEAVGAFEKVLHLDPGRAGHYYNLGLCQFSMNNWDAALASWLTAFAHDEKDGPTNKGLAVVYWKRKDYKQAWETVARCQALGIALDPDFIAALQQDSGQKGP